MLELGHGCCFEARQKRILIGDTHGFIDLVFDRRILKRHVLIELKVDAFKYEVVDDRGESRKSGEETAKSPSHAPAPAERAAGRGPRSARRTRGLVAAPAAGRCQQFNRRPAETPATHPESIHRQLRRGV